MYKIRVTDMFSAKISYNLLFLYKNMSENLKGAGWIVLSCACAAVMVSLIKLIGSQAHSTVIVVGRCLFGVIFLLPLLYRKGFATLGSSQLKLHLIRGCFVAVGINLGFYSLTILPITTVTVLFFSAPLFVTLLARPMLSEAVGIRRLSATFVGFLGTIIVLNPIVENFDVRLLFPIVSSMFFSVSLILHKKLSETDPPWVLMFYMFTITLFLTAPIAMGNVTELNWELIVIICVIAVFATMRTYSDIRGYSAGDVSFVASFQYLRILFIGGVAYVLFDETFRFNEWIGMTVIISSTLYIAHREYKMGKNSIAQIGRGFRGSKLN